MSQNTSSAVMQQRSEPHDSLDDFPTPSWATRALCEHLNTYSDISSETCWEPCCNRGYMARPLAESFRRVYASDVYDYGWTGQEATRDFLTAYQRDDAPAVHVDWVIANPPFRLASQFALRAFDVARTGVALFVRISFLEGVGRYEELFSVFGPEWVLQFTERVIIHKGVVRDPQEEYWDEKDQRMRRPSSATSYCWIIWLAPYASGEGLQAPYFRWVPPCRKRLERPEDYL